MEDNNTEFLQQASSELAKEDEIQTDTIPNVEQPEAIAEKELEIQTEKFKPKSAEAIAEKESEIQAEKFELPIAFDDSKEPEVIPIIMYPCKGHFSDDSSTDSSFDVSDSASDSEAIGEEKSEIQTEKFEDSDPFDDDNNEPEVIPIIMYPCTGHFSDDSSIDSSYFSNSDETIAEEESKINKESSPKDKDRETQLKSPSNASPQDNQTPSEPIEERPKMELYPKSSTTEPMSRPTVPTSSILVKHGTKRPIEAEVGDEESKRAEKLALSKSTIENVQN